MCTPGRYWLQCWSLQHFEFPSLQSLQGCRQRHPLWSAYFLELIICTKLAEHLRFTLDDWTVWAIYLFEAEKRDIESRQSRKVECRKKWNCRVRVYVFLEFFRAWQLILELGCLGTQNMGTPARIKDSEACIFRLMKILTEMYMADFPTGCRQRHPFRSFFLRNWGQRILDLNVKDCILD